MVANLRTNSLLRVATLAARPEFRQELAEELRQIKADGSATETELYEVCLQLYLFAGFPAALEAVRALWKVFGSRHTDSGSNFVSSMNYEKNLEAGTDLYKRVYADKAERVREEIIRLSPELAEWALVEGYGKTLSRTGLDSRTRELCVVATLTQLGWDRQLYSHIMGAKNVRASAEEISNAILIGAKGDIVKFASAEQLMAKLV